MTSADSEHPVVIFDGECGFCGATVDFILEHDPTGVFRFVASVVGSIVFNLGGGAIDTLTHFFPMKANGGTWVTVECCSTDNNTNWGANGQPPDPTYEIARWVEIPIGISKATIRERVLRKDR